MGRLGPVLAIGGAVLVTLLLFAGLASHSSHRKLEIHHNSAQSSLKMARVQWLAGEDVVTSSGSQPATSGAPVSQLDSQAVSINLDVDHGTPTAEEAKYLANKTAFAEDNPEQAARIHLKRKAERQAALREEYLEKRKEAIEALSETGRARNTITIILTLIVLITVMFEKIAHWVMHTCSPFSKPVIEILFKELTVLGFIALCVFMAVKTGIPQQISEFIFGTPSELVEMFDETHVLLFLIVVLFVSMVGLILWKFSSYCDDWENWEIIALDAAKQGKSVAEMQNLSHGYPPRPLPEEIKTYFVMRHAFFNPHVATRPALDASFRFSEYLKECTSITFKKLVEVEAETWMVVIVLIGMARLYMMIPHVDMKLAIFLLIGIILLYLTILCRNKLIDVYMMLVKPGYHDSGVSYYVWKARQEQKVLANTRVEDRGWFFRICNGDSLPNPHQQLFWFGMSGPVFLLHAVRTTIFMCSVYFALLAFNYMSELSGETSGGLHTTVLLTLAIVSPVILMTYYMPQVLKLLIIVTSIEMMRNNGVVHAVEHKIKARRRMFISRLLHSLKAHARCLLRQGGAGVISTALDTPRDREIDSVFTIFEEECPNHRGVRFVPASKVQDFFLQLGLQLDEHELEDVILELGDGLPGIVYEQTIEFLGSTSHHGIPDQMIDAIFVDIDKDNSDPKLKYDNEITEDEFCAKLVQINSFFGTSGVQGGAEQLVDWLDWAIITHKLQIATDGKQLSEDGFETSPTRVFTPHTFRQLIRQGTTL